MASSSTFLHLPHLSSKCGISFVSYHTEKKPQKKNKQHKTNETKAQNI